MNDLVRIGKIGRIEEYGLGVLVDEESSTAYPFTLDKLEGYKGEPVKSLRLKRGSIVRFRIENDEVVSVSPQQEKVA